LNVRGHAVLLTNARDVEVVGNLFDGVWAGEGVNMGGFCIDVSQGVRGCVVSNNIARNSTYFTKTESYTVFGSTDDNLTTDVVIANNECIDMRPVYQSGAYVSGFAIFINSRTGNVVVEGNRITYNKGNGIYIYGSSAGNGSVIVKGNVIVQTDAGTYSSSGIYCEPNSFNRVLVQGNTVHGFLNGIVCHVGMASIHDNDVSALQAAIAVNGASEVSIEGNDLRGVTGVTFGNSTPQFYKRIRACGNRIKATTGICFDMTNAQNPAGCVIQGNIFEKTDTGADLPALSANNIESWVVSGNTFSVPAASMRALGLFGTVKTSVIRDNITNGIHQIAAMDAATVQQGNLTSAAAI
jgi:parallel beta-helix repeat protein